MSIIKRELLKESEKAFQFLHTAAGFDFEKDYFITKAPGKFTYNTIINTVKNSFSDSYRVVILVSPSATCNKTGLIYAVLEDGKIDGTRREGVKYYNYRDIDYCWGVGDFEELRKKYTDHIYIIAQSMEYIKPTMEKAFDFKERFIIKDFQRCTDQNRSSVWLSSINLIVPDGSGRKFEYKPFDYYRQGEHRTDILTDYIDKSGYIIRMRRQELKRSAESLRTQRNKAAADAANYDNRIMSLSARIDSARASLASSFTAAGTHEQMKAICKKMDSFSWVLFEFELFTKRINNKEFSSISRIESDILHMIEKLNAIEEVEQ